MRAGCEGYGAMMMPRSQKPNRGGTFLISASVSGDVAAAVTAAAGRKRT